MLCGVLGNGSKVSYDGTLSVSAVLKFMPSPDGRTARHSQPSGKQNRLKDSPLVALHNLV